MFEDYVKLAFNNVKKRGIRSWLTMLGIFIGIAAVVALISLGQGLQNAITGQFGELDPDKLTVQNAETGFGPPGSTAVAKLNQHDIDIIMGIQGVEFVIPRYIRSVKVEYNDIAKFEIATNVPEGEDEIEVVYDALNVKVAEGRLLNKNDRKKVFLGEDFTNENKYDKKISIGKKVKIQGVDFDVIGFAKLSSSIIFNDIVMIAEEDLEEILDIKDEFDILVIQVQDAEEIGKIKQEIEDKFRDDRNQELGEEDFSVQTPEQSIQTVNTILVGINLVVGGIAAISLLVGGVGITNTMYTSVLERTKEIGIMKAVGAKNKDILWVFLIESALLGLVGGIIGAAIGIGLALLVSYGVTTAFSGINFTVAISYPLLTLAILFSLVIGSISGILPALQASKLKPVEALRR